MLIKKKKIISNGTFDLQQKIWLGIHKKQMHCTNASRRVNVGNNYQIIERK